MANFKALSRAKSDITASFAKRRIVMVSRDMICLADLDNARIFISRRIAIGMRITARQKSLCRQHWQSSYQLKFSDIDRRVYGRRHWGQPWGLLMTYDEVNQNWPRIK